ncbi:post-transcriptional regulator, partial [Catenibacterium sp.]
DGVEKIVAAEIEDYLRNVVWRNKIAITFCDMIDDIMSLQFSTIFEYLQAKVIKEAETKNLADFQSLIMK